MCKLSSYDLLTPRSRAAAARRGGSPGESPETHAPFENLQIRRTTGQRIRPEPPAGGPKRADAFGIRGGNAPDGTGSRTGAARPAYARPRRYGDAAERDAGRHNRG